MKSSATDSSSFSGRAHSISCSERSTSSATPCRGSAKALSLRLPVQPSSSVVSLHPCSLSISGALWAFVCPIPSPGSPPSCSSSRPIASVSAKQAEQIRRRKNPAVVCVCAMLWREEKRIDRESICDCCSAASQENSFAARYRKKNCCGAALQGKLNL